MTAEIPDLGYALTLPPKEAIAYFKQKGYRISWDWRDTWQEAHARAFTVAKVARMDLLQDIRGAVESALKEGHTEAWFERELTPVLQAKGWWGRQAVTAPDDSLQTVQLGSPGRLKTIFRTNMQTAYQAGRYVQFVQNAQARPYFQYVAVMDARTRPSHAAMNGRVFRWDDPVWNTAWPPCAFNCRCRVRALGPRDLKDRGLSVESSEGRLFQTTVSAGTNTTTGEVIQAPVTALRIPPRLVRVATRDSWTPPPGATRKESMAAYPKVKAGQTLTWDPANDPKWSEGEGSPWTVKHKATSFRPDAGWSYNPARAAFMPDLDRYANDIARQFVAGVLNGPEFTRWYSIWERTVADEIAAHPSLSDAELVSLIRKKWAVPGKYYPTAILPDHIRAALNATTQVVRLSDDTLCKQIVNRKGSLNMADYQHLQATLEAPDVMVAEKGNHWLLYRDKTGKIYLAVIKVAGGGKEIWLQSFRRATPAEMAKAAGKGG